MWSSPSLKVLLIRQWAYSTSKPFPLEKNRVDRLLTHSVEEGSLVVTPDNSLLSLAGGRSSGEQRGLWARGDSCWPPWPWDTEISVGLGLLGSLRGRVGLGADACRAAATCSGCCGSVGAGTREQLFKSGGVSGGHPEIRVWFLKLHYKAPHGRPGT